MSHCPIDLFPFRVWVNPDFTQFVTVDDAGICYILDEYIPAGNFLR